MEFPSMPPIRFKAFEAFYKFPNYRAIHHKLCGKDSRATWSEGCSGFHSHYKRLCLCIDAKVMLWFVNNTITPSKNDTYVSKLKATYVSDNYGVYVELILLEKAFDITFATTSWADRKLALGLSRGRPALSNLFNYSLRTIRSVLRIETPV
ncbi:hypothetical protein HAX54_003731 [Datura stramonium]|uniref:Transposase n=1 Tax=Datura stramonium TaxID=4076 RepID=A0ABS8WSD9_DATST|nr:hypothetical protein [Datura stramonium]